MSYNINDPIYKMMSFSKRQSHIIKPIIDQPEFQRLRHITQLGLVQLVFPGAVNTRFNHCLGACNLANLISAQLELEPELNDLAVLAALIHDIGHGPFSHLFERILPNDKKIKHDHEWLQCFLQQFHANGVLSFTQLQACQSIFALADKSEPLFIVSDIVSSQLDADRLDYLLRDSYYCGVSYGQFNLDWLLRCMQRVKVDGIDRLGVVKKGMGALEHYIMCRRLMTKNIYANGKINGARFLLQRFLLLLSQQVQQPQLLDVRNTILGQYCALLQDYHLDNINKSSFLERSFPFYQQLIDDDVWLLLRELASNRDRAPINQLARRLYYRCLPHAIAFEHSQLQAVEASVTHFFADHPGMGDWQCHIEKLDFVSYQKRQEPIYVEGESPLFDFLADQTEPSYWLYIDRDIMPLFQEYWQCQDLPS